MNDRSQQVIVGRSRLHSRGLAETAYSIAFDVIT